VLTTAVPLHNLFLSDSDINHSLADCSFTDQSASDHSDMPDHMRSLMDDLGLSMSALKSSSLFNDDEERFAFARALSRLTEMGNQQWIESGLGMGMTTEAGQEDRAAWRKTRSRWGEDIM
jgi:peroxisome-assembly ATPase